MSVLWTLVVGLFVGIIAKLLHPGKENMGFIMTVLLGIGGSFVAGFVGKALGWYQPDETAGFIASVIGAIVLLAVYGRLREPPQSG